MLPCRWQDFLGYGRRCTGGEAFVSLGESLTAKGAEAAQRRAPLKPVSRLTKTLYSVTTGRSAGTAEWHSRPGALVFFVRPWHRWELILHSNDFLIPAKKRLGKTVPKSHQQS